MRIHTYVACAMGLGLTITLTPSSNAGAQDTTNATDGIARRAGPRAYARVAQDGTGWRAELVVGVAPV